MADTKISALAAVGSVVAANEFAVNEAGTSKKATAAQVKSYTMTLITGSVGVANPADAPSETWQRLSTNSPTLNSSTIALCMSTTDIPIGTYRFNYDIIAQSVTTTTNSHKFAVNHTGTTPRFVYNLFAPSAGVTAATGAIDQEVNTTTGNVWSHNSTRAKNATLGPYTDVDSTNVDVNYRIEGLFQATTSGTLTLGFAGEITSSCLVTADTHLILKRLA